MSVGDILYVIAMGIFIFFTFGIVRNYYKSKFDDEGHRIDMQEKRMSEEQEEQ